MRSWRSKEQQSVPEGPTIKVTADVLRQALQNQTIQAFRSPLKKTVAEDWRSKIEGQQVEVVRSHGKHLLIEFSSHYVLYSHMLMWGAWHVYTVDEEWRKPVNRARVVLATATHVAVLFNAPICELIHRDQLAQHITSSSGPDLLSDTFDIEEARSRFYAPEHAEREVGELIMDQQVLAGIGNVLKSEVLFQAGIHPQRTPGTITPDEFDRIITTSRELMRVSYELGTFEGAFLPKDLEVQGGKYGYVYRRRGYPCVRCGTPIRMVRQGPRQRMTWYCPQCQPYIGPNNPDLVPDRRRRVNR
jgi:endonuclease-8